MGLSGLQDKVAIVTGGAGGIGAAVAQRLADEGVAVVIVDLDVDASRAVAKRLPGAAIGVGADVSTEEGVSAYMEAAIDRFGGVDYAHLNAGYLSPLAPLPETDPAQFERVIAVNARSVYLGLKALIPQMRERGGGAIVATTSGLGERGMAGVAPYAAAKQAVPGLMRTAAMETAREGIRINAISPGLVDTAMIRVTERSLAADDPVRGRAILEESVPLGRYARPEEIAAAVAWLLSDEASYVTGLVLSADGGSSAGSFTSPT